MSERLSAFRHGDIRGVYPDEIDETFVAAFAHAFVGHFRLSGKIATGRDTRDSSGSLHESLNQALKGCGIDVVDLGLCPTELGYFASAQAGIYAAIIVTASHNAAHFNGLKCVLKNGQAVTLADGLEEVRSLMLQGHRQTARSGTITRVDYHSAYQAFLTARFDKGELEHHKVALNGLNGTAATIAAPMVDALALDAVWFRREPGSMPTDGVDPSSPPLVAQMKQFMQGGDFSYGVAWDGDCDRCAFFDERGDLVPTYYIIGILVEKFLKDSPGAAIVFDSKLCWNTLDMIQRYGGQAIPAQTGHAFMKKKMHESGAVYGGELSSHHYFGDFYGCDSGMLAWLTVAAMLADESQSCGQPSGLAERIALSKTQVFSAQEINLILTDVGQALSLLQKRYAPRALQCDRFDGLSFVMPGDWRFSVRQSNTEPVVRINFEARQTADNMLIDGLTVLELLEPFCAEEMNWSSTFRLQ